MLYIHETATSTEGVYRAISESISCVKQPKARLRHLQLPEPAHRTRAKTMALVLSQNYRRNVVQKTQVKIAQRRRRP